METSHLKQKAVLWAATGVDSYSEVKVSAAVEVPVRWETGQKEAIDPQGSTIALESTVYVDRVVAVGSILWLGKLVDVPGTPTNLRQVVIFKAVPDVKGRKFRYSVGVIKYSNELPALA